MIDPDAERPAGITVRFPVLKPDGLPEAIEYPIACIKLMQDITTPDMLLTTISHALLNAAGPYPPAPFSIYGEMGWGIGVKMHNRL